MKASNRNVMSDIAFVRLPTKIENVNLVRIRKNTDKIFDGLKEWMLYGYAYSKRTKLNGKKMRPIYMSWPGGNQ